MNTLVKATILILLGYAIYRQVFAQEKLPELWSAFLVSFQSENYPWLVVVITLLPINWGLEALKWYQLTKASIPVSYWQLYRAVLSGVTISLFTPNRVGEYAGRILLVEARHNWKALIAAAVGGLSQMLVLISMGLLGLIVFSSKFLKLGPEVTGSLWILGIVFIGIIVYCYYNVAKLLDWGKRISWVHRLKKYGKYVSPLRSYRPRELSLALLFAFLRYGTYTLQYYFILCFFGLYFPLLPALSGIAAIFLFQTGVPLPPVLSLLARGELALLVWNYFEANELSILGASFSLFIINLGVPAFVGIVLIIKTNILKSLGYEIKGQ